MNPDFDPPVPYGALFCFASCEAEECSKCSYESYKYSQWFDSYDYDEHLENAECTCMIHRISFAPKTMSQFDVNDSYLSDVPETTPQETIYVIYIEKSKPFCEIDQNVSIEIVTSFDMNSEDPDDFQTLVEIRPTPHRTIYRRDIKTSHLYANAAFDKFKTILMAVAEARRQQKLDAKRVTKSNRPRKGKKICSRNASRRNAVDAGQPEKKPCPHVGRRMK